MDLLTKLAFPIIIILGILGFLTQLEEGNSNQQPSLFGPSQTTSFGSSLGEERIGNSGIATPTHPLSAEEIAKELEEIERQIELLTRAVNASRYQDLVTLRSARAHESDEDREYIAIEFDEDFPGLVSISPWRLESARTGRKVTIGAADTVPFRRYRQTDPVAIQGGDTVYVHTGDSPINVSFRTNLCTGYLSREEGGFTPRLPDHCPRIINEIDEDLIYGRRSLSDRCIRAIERIDRCEIPEDIRETAGSRCEDIVEEYTRYENCVRLHQNDIGFAGNIWHIYLDRRSEFWRQEREIITLYDEVGKVVDVVSY